MIENLFDTYRMIKPFDLSKDTWRRSHVCFLLSTWILLFLHIKQLPEHLSRSRCLGQSFFFFELFLLPVFFSFAEWRYQKNGPASISRENRTCDAISIQALVLAYLNRILRAIWFFLSCSLLPNLRGALARDIEGSFSRARQHFYLACTHLHAPT